MVKVYNESPSKMVVIDGGTPYDGSFPSGSLIILRKESEIAVYSEHFKQKIIPYTPFNEIVDINGDSYGNNVRDVEKALNLFFLNNTTTTDDVVNTSDAIGSSVTDAFNGITPTTEYLIKTVEDFFDKYGFPVNGSNQITLPKGVFLIDSFDLQMGVYTLVTSNDITIRGFSQNTTKISSTEENINLIESNGANLFIEQINISCVGAGSQAIFMDGTGVESLDMNYVSFSGNTAWGTISNIRQGFIVFGFAMNSERGFLLQGAFGGFRISSSRYVDVGQYILKGDTGFTCDNIRSDVNATIPIGAFAFDFDYNMFNNDGGYQLSGGRYDGDGEMVSDFTVGSGTDNVLAERSARSLFINNTGDKGRETVINVIGQAEKLEGITTYSFLEHFAEDGNNNAKHTSSERRRIKIEGDITVRCTQNDTVRITIQKFDTTLGTPAWVDIKSYERIVLRLQGARDIASFPISAQTLMVKDDLIRVAGANMTSTDNMTMESSSELIWSKL